MGYADVGSTSSTLLREIRDWGNHSAWAQVHTQYEPLLRSCCRELALDDQSADEVCQSTWIEVAERMESFEYDPNRSFRGWLRTVCRHKALDYLRRRKNNCVLPPNDRDDRLQTADWRSRFADKAEEEEGEAAHELLSQLQLRAKEVQTAVRAKVLPKTWEAFWLIAIMSWSVDETVSFLGITHYSAYKAKMRVAQQLKAEAERRFGSSGAGGF
jgi:RNA polymerase sigma factor (sigma-70 family)